jgi:hypothetical protein
MFLDGYKWGYLIQRRDPQQQGKQQYQMGNGKEPAFHHLPVSSVHESKSAHRHHQAL